MWGQFWNVIFGIRRRLFGLTLFATFVLLFAGALGAGLYLSEKVVAGFGEQIEKLAQKSKELPPPAGELPGELFAKLVTQRLIQFDPVKSTLELRVDCTAHKQGFSQYNDGLQKTAAGGTKAEITDRQVVSQLCASDPGTAIRQEVSLWNRSASVIAVRDNSSAGQPCQDGSVPEGYVPANCYESAWQAGFASPLSAGAAAPVAAAAVIPGSPRNEVVSIMRAAPFGFGPWRRFDASSFPAGKLFLRAVVRPNNSHGMRRVVVDVIGDLDPTVAPVVITEGANNGRAPLSIERFCDRASTATGCARAARRAGGNRMARGVRLTFEFDAARAAEVRIAAMTINAVTRKVALLDKARFVTLDDTKDYDDEATIRLTDRIHVLCRHVDPDVIAEDLDNGDDLSIKAPDVSVAARELDLCGLHWEAPRHHSVPKTSGSLPSDPPAPLVAQGLLEAGLLSVRLADPERVVLTKVVKRPDPSGLRSEISRVVATDEARLLGLVPVVGLDDSDDRSLLGQLRRRVPPAGQREIELTIDARLQRGAVDILKDLATRARPLSDISDLLLTEHDASRRSAIVMIDAGASGIGGSGFDTMTGRILASASWPQMDSRSSEQDLKAFETNRTWLSPLAARGWSDGDRFNAPGSAFKPIVVLAAIDRAARGDDSIADFMGAEQGRRGLAPSELQAFGGRAAAALEFKYTSKALVVPVRSSGKTARITTSGGDICTDMSGGRGCRPGATTPVSMRNMLVRSNNIWFSRLALALDGDAVTTTAANGAVVEITDSEKPANRPLAISSIVSRLWPADASNIMVGDEVSRYSRVRANAVRVDEVNAAQPRRYSIALNGIGQAAQATPLAMASMYASIATGRIVLPRLTTANDTRSQRGAPLFDASAMPGVPLLDQNRADEMLRNLRAAMADVVRSGTAAQTFGTLTPRVSGKTGTAQIGTIDETNGGARNEDFNTTWFVGWIEGLRVTGFERRRVAFACMVTHAQRDNAGGGRVCAPLMGALLARFEAHGGLPRASARTTQ